MGVVVRGPETSHIRHQSTCASKLDLFPMLHSGDLTIFYSFSRTLCIALTSVLAYMGLPLVEVEEQDTDALNHQSYHFGQPMISSLPPLSWEGVPPEAVPQLISIAMYSFCDSSSSSLSS